MSALQKLWFLKLKSKIRNLFKRPVSAIFTVLMIVFYGFIFVSMLTLDKSDITKALKISVHQSVMIAIGFTALMMVMTLFQKRKALFFAEDAYYLFSGPFTRIQIMKYLLSQTILQSMLFGAIAVFVMVCLAPSAGAFTVSFYLICFLVVCLICAFFSMLTDYLYVLSITNQRYQKLSKLIASLLIAIVLGLFAFFFIQNGGVVEGAFNDFVTSSLFYLVPILGWGKLAIITFYDAQYLMFALMLSLMIVSTGIVYYFFTRFKGDFFEQALEDSFALSDLMKKAKAGDNTMNTQKKIRAVTLKFKPGAMAIYSKHMLQLKKTNGYINKNDLIVIAIYFVVSLFQGFTFFNYMLMFWLFSSLQNSDMSEELKHFQIYLIPQHPMKKLIALVLPTFLKTSITAIAAIVIGGIYFQLSLMDILQNSVVMIGYIMIFISATILCCKVLKSRTNSVMENLMRMLIVVVCALPTLIITFNIINDPASFSTWMLYIITYGSLVMNFVISFVILYACKNMLNGKELNDD